MFPIHAHRVPLGRPVNIILLRPPAIATHAAQEIRLRNHRTQQLLPNRQRHAGVRTDTIHVRVRVRR